MQMFYFHLEFVHVVYLQRIGDVLTLREWVHVIP